MINRHFTATTYIFNKEKPETLLHWHKKLQSWLPPGGHIEKNEDPYQTAVREIIEEYSIDKLEFITPPHIKKLKFRYDQRAHILQMPFFIIEEEIEKSTHYHLDFIYYAYYKGPIKDDLKWFSKNDIITGEKIFNNVKKLALYGFDNLY